MILRDDWWRRDNGPLVGFLTLDPEQKIKRPVALLPLSSRSYEMVDPAAGTRVPVDAAVAESLSGDAHMFYPPLPERPLDMRDLLRATFAGPPGRPPDHPADGSRAAASSACSCRSSPGSSSAASSRARTGASSCRSPWP